MTLRKYVVIRIAGNSRLRGAKNACYIVSTDGASFTFPDYRQGNAAASLFIAGAVTPSVGRTAAHDYSLIDVSNYRFVG